MSGAMRELTTTERKVKEMSSIEKDFRELLQKQDPAEVLTEWVLKEPREATIRAVVELINSHKYSIQELLTCDVENIRRVVKALVICSKEKANEQNQVSGD
jgi:hypothetical protein